jgi:hypothetical protein
MNRSGGPAVPVRILRKVPAAAASLRRRFIAAAKLSSTDEVVNRLAVPNPLLVTAVRRSTSAHSKAAPSR